MSEGQRARHGISLSLSGRSDKAVAVCQAPLMNGRSLPMDGGDGGHENGDRKTEQGPSWSTQGRLGLYLRPSSHCLTDTAHALSMNTTRRPVTHISGFGLCSGVATLPRYASASACKCCGLDAGSVVVPPSDPAAWRTEEGLSSSPAPVP